MQTHWIDKMWVDSNATELCGPEAARGRQPFFSEKKQEKFFVFGHSIGAFQIKPLPVNTPKKVIQYTILYIYLLRRQTSPVNNFKANSEGRRLQFIHFKILYCSLLYIYIWHANWKGRTLQLIHYDIIILYYIYNFYIIK